MGSKSPTQTTTREVKEPSYVTGAQQNMLSSVFGTLTPQLAPGAGVVPLNPDQEAAYGQIRGALGQPISSNAYSFAPAQAASMAAANASPASMAAAQLDPNAYKPFLNPYTNEVVDRTTANMQRQHEADLNAIRARAAASNSFADSGARAALKEGQSTDNYTRAVGDVTAKLMAEGFDRATATAMANTQLSQQTNAANAGYQQQANLANAGFQQAANAANAGYQQNVNLYNAQGGNETAARNVDYADTVSRQRLQDVLGIGNAQQAAAQTALNRPLDVARLLAAATPQQYGSTTTDTSPNKSPTPLATILGLAGTAAGAYFGGPAGASAGGSLGTGLGSLFGPSQSDLMLAGRRGLY